MCSFFILFFISISFLLLFVIFVCLLVSFFLLVLPKLLTVNLYVFMTYQCNKRNSLILEKWCENQPFPWRFICALIYISDSRCIIYNREQPNTILSRRQRRRKELRRRTAEETTSEEIAPRTAKSWTAPNVRNFMSFSSCLAKAWH